MVHRMDFEDNHRGHGSNRRDFPEKRQHSCCVRVLIVSNMFLIIAIALSLIVIYRFAVQIKKNEAAANVCQTAGCLQAAANVLQYINVSDDPCNDFYDFACGKFISETTLTEDKYTEGSFSLLSDQMQKQLRQLINAHVEDSDLMSFRFPKELFALCMNQTQIEENGLKPLIDIHASLGGWPCVEGANWNRDSTYNWRDGTRDLLRTGFGHEQLFSILIDVDMKNSSRKRIMLDDPILGLSRGYLLNGLSDKVVQAYYDYMVDLAIMLGANRARAKEELLDVLEFETSLANISLAKERRRNSSEMYNAMTLNEANRKYPYLDWIEYLNDLFPSNVRINGNETVIFKSLPFFDNFERLLQSIPKRTIANYLLWRVTLFSAYYMNSDVRKRQLAFGAVYVGQKEWEPRRDECTTITNNKLSTATGALYIRKYFQPEDRKAAAQLVDQIRKQFKEGLKQITWMDVKTKLAANNKIDTMVTHIGYPDELYNDTKLEEYHKTLVLHRTNYLQSILNIINFHISNDLNSLRKPIDKSKWHSSATLVSASYWPDKNSIELPAGILQGLFFSAIRPSYMNFGAIGFIIGHEVTHGFDDEGKQYDQNGDLLNWWDNATEIQFLQRTRCIIDQYSNFTEPLTNLSINGINTQGENIADNGGIKLSYNAYRKWTEKNGVEKRLPGLKQYSPEQMFWISAALPWCSVDRAEYRREKIVNDEHAPDRERIIGSFSNLHEFSRDFNCKLGSPMNPENKCTVW